MQYHILAVGDVVGEPGLRHLEKNLRPCKNSNRSTLLWLTARMPPAWA